MHLLAIGAWVGLVYVAAYIVVPRIVGEPSADRANGADYVQALSSAAAFALAVLVVTGAYLEPSEFVRGSETQRLRPAHAFAVY